MLVRSAVRSWSNNNENLLIKFLDVLQSKFFEVRHFWTQEIWWREENNFFGLLPGLVVFLD